MTTLVPHPAPCPATGALVASLLRFRHDTDGPWLLDGVDLRIAPGRSVGVVGPSGSGTTVLTELLARVAEPTSGRITLGGVDLRELSPHDVRGTVVLAARDADLVAGTVRENLMPARRSASESELWDALGTVELDEWVRGLPDGLDTFLDASGEFVPDGMASRVALARAVLSHARFVILDEPTAGLDAALARRLLTNVLERLADRGVLVVSHDRDALAGVGLVAELYDGHLRAVA